jgi:hypothetical protein
MLNRILYWFITLPALAKGGCLTAFAIVFVCSCLTVASIPGARARQVAQATQTAVAAQAQATQAAVAAQAQATQVALNSTATSIADATAAALANQAATATSIAVAEIATQTAIAAPTVTAQAYADATNTALAGATATSQAYIDATNTAAAQATSDALQTAEAIAAEKATAEAIPTATALARAAATATAEAIEATYQEIDIRALVKNPDRYTGVPIKLTGQVFRIEEEIGRTAIQMWVQIPGGSEFDREAVAVFFDGTLDEVFKDSYIVVYGTGAGKIEGTNAFGGTVVQPLIKAEYVRY